MDQPIAELLAASLAFVGSHFAMSHPLRAPMVRVLGDKGFMAAYSLVSFATFGWMVVAFRAAPPWESPLWTGRDELGWAIAMVLTLVALVLFLGSLRSNPATPDPRAAVGLETREPTGVFKVTRHPMMWGFALWAIAHIAIMPTGRTLVLAGAMAVLALVGAHLQDRKKEALMGPAWQAWEAKTSYWPRWSQLPGAGAGLWLAALVLWLGATWAHVWIAYVPAGIWRWVG